MRGRILLCFLWAGLASAGQVVITVLATTDLHGNLYPVDYGTGRPANRGLAKVATLIRAAEAENPNHILIDCGDTIQGSPLEYVYQSAVRSGTSTAAHDPMMLAMNRLGYAAMAVGNHEYNFGRKNFDRARSDAAFPWLSANTAVAAGGKERPFAPYVVKTVAGVKIAIIGITTPAVPTWEKPENLGSYRFLDPIDAVRKSLAKLRAAEHPDLVLVASHSGIGEDHYENVVNDLAAAVPQLDAILFGHTHSQLEGRDIAGVLVVQPKNWGISLARIDFTLEREGAGPWKLTGRKSRLIPVTDQTAAAADILEIGKPYHEAAERYLSSPVAESARDLSSALGRVEDTAVVDAIQQVQLFYAKADVAFTALFNKNVHIPKGPVTVRQIAALYPYDNELYAIEGDGRIVKDALENAARYFLSCTGARCAEAPLTNREVMDFNYDMAEGVEYEIDLTRPEGDRIRNLRWKGRPLAPDQKLRIAINNYRAAGSAGYSMFRGAKIVWKSQDEIRDLIVRYYTERKTLPAVPTNNWRVVPDAARATLVKQAEAEAAHPTLQ
jgi:2',3'-cyclic-nucleotide 2'-phosphodiesterase/3'-nucleotidase